MHNERSESKIVDDARTMPDFSPACLLFLRQHFSCAPSRISDEQLLSTLKHQGIDSVKAALENLQDTAVLEESLIFSTILYLLDPSQENAEPVFAKAIKVGESALALEAGTWLHKTSDMPSAQKAELAKILLEDGRISEAADILDDIKAQAGIARWLFGALLIAQKSPVTTDYMLSLFRIIHKRADKRNAEIIARYQKNGGFVDDAEIWKENLDTLPPTTRRQVACALTRAGRIDILDANQIADIFGQDNDFFLWQGAYKSAKTGNAGILRASINRLFFENGLSLISFENKKNTERIEQRGQSVFETFAAPTARRMKAAPDLPLVSIIMTAYNANDTIGYAYRSLTAQTYPHIEIIIVDDAGEQRAADAVNIAGDRPTTFIRNEQNTGTYACRNQGIEKARGTLIAFHDADDWAHPEKIEHQVNHILSGDFYAQYGRHIRMNRKGDIQLENSNQFIGDGPITGLFKKEIFAQCGMFFPTRTRGDIEFKRRATAIMGAKAILQSDAPYVLSLDWASNSKIHTDTWAKETRVRRFLERAQSLQRSLTFIAPENRTRETVAKLLDIAPEEQNLSAAATNVTPLPTRKTGRTRLKTLLKIL